MLENHETTQEISVWGMLPLKVGDCHADFASGIEMMVHHWNENILLSWIRRQKHIEYVYQMDALGNIMFRMILHIHFSHTIHLTDGCQLITSNIINYGSMLILPNTLSISILLRASGLYHTLKEHHQKVKNTVAAFIHSISRSRDLEKNFRKLPSLGPAVVAKVPAKLWPTGPGPSGRW